MEDAMEIKAVRRCEVKTAEQRWAERVVRYSGADSETVSRGDYLGDLRACEAETRAQVLAECAASEKKAREDEREWILDTLRKRREFEKAVRVLEMVGPRPHFDHGTNETEIAASPHFKNFAALSEKVSEIERRAGEAFRDMHNRVADLESWRKA